jgi:hypothetical protein
VVDKHDQVAIQTHKRFHGLSSLAGSCEAHNMIRSIAHDQPQKNFKYLWLDFRE